jgi:chaperone modulatory protein CbpM
MTTTALARPVHLDLETFSRAVTMHPEVVRRLVALGLLDAYSDAAGELWFAPTQLPAAARVQRLRAGFGLSYASLGLVTELLDRIARLERALRARPGAPR